MTYIPEGSGGGGSVSGSSDVALNNTVHNDILTYDGTISKWKNAQVAQPLGTMSNPVTDSTAVRPSGVPIVVWRTDTTPVNALAGDWIFLPDNSGEGAGSATKYRETFDTTDLSGWGAKENAGSFTRDTSRDAGPPGTMTASLRWAAPDSGNSTAQSPLIGSLSGATMYVARIKVSSAAATTRGIRVLADEYDSVGNYLLSSTGDTFSVEPSESFTEINLTVTTQANTVQMRVYVQVLSVASNEIFYVDNVTVSL